MYFSVFIEGHYYASTFLFKTVNYLCSARLGTKSIKVEAKLSDGAPVVMSVPAGPVLVYNQDYATLASNLRTLHQGQGSPRKR